MEAISGLNRGLNASDEDKATVERLTQGLERLNPNKNSLEAPEINGKWRLIYTTSDSILGTNRPAFARPVGPIHQYIGAPITWPLASLVHCRKFRNSAEGGAKLLSAP